MSEPSVPPGIDLEMLAEDLAGCISKYGYAEAGFDVDSRAVLAVLPEFVTGALAVQARLDQLADTHSDRSELG